MILIYIFIFLVLFFIFLKFIGRNYENPYKLNMIFGKKGSGKTTFFTKLSIKYNNKGYVVYSNVPIYGARLFNVDDFGHYSFPEESVILIDEVKTIWDSRDFKSFDKKVRDQFIYQRHDKLIIWLASQQFNVDKTIRDLCDNLYLLTCFCNVFSIAKKINKRITIHNGDENNESFLTEDFSFSLPFDWHFTFIPRYVHFFDSFDSKKMNPIKYKEFRSNDFFLRYIMLSKNYFKYQLSKMIYRSSKLYNSFKILIFNLKKSVILNLPISFNISEKLFQKVLESSINFYL